MPDHHAYGHVLSRYPERLCCQVHGVAAHSSKPHLGKNALVAASDLILRMYSEHESLQTDEMIKRPLGAPTITPTMSSGGHGPNIVPQDASGAHDRMT